MSEKFWHNRQVKDIVVELKSDIHQGLSDSTVEEKLQKFGYNEIKEKQKKTLLEMFLEQFKDFMVIVLLIAAVISFVSHERTDAIIILAIVVLNAILGVVQESRAEKSLEALKKMSAPNAKVLRDAKVKIIPAKELVPGDIIYLEAGDFVPADARLIETANLKVEESALTGESMPVDKNAELIEEEKIPLGDRKNMVASSSVVTYGRGSAIVVATGMSTEVGKIAKMILSGEEVATPLQQKLAQLGKMLGIAALAICALIFGIGVIEGRDIFEMFLTAVSLAVAAIPEGLPAIVTIVLAVGVQRMVKKHAIIRKLPAVETLGSASVICSDKTGTLTQNKMTVVELATSERSWELNGEINDEDKKVVSTILEMASLCNDSKLEKVDNEWDAVGDPTETALVIAAAKLDKPKPQLEEKTPRVSEVPFDSDRKMMTTIHKIEEGYRIITKGAPDVLLDRCINVWTNGDIVNKDEQQIKNIEKANGNMADKALRVLGVAFRDIKTLPEEISTDTVERDLTFIGLIGMIDPPREEAKEAVRLCKRAGIKAVMITGDHKATAVAIARDLGILQNNSEALTGAELDELDQEFLNQNVDKYAVYARVSPEHKVKIVKAWQSKGHIVAMTGDGVNDAPALKSANIGCAMGITGTDVAKGAAHMVLTDDNFATIVEAVREGRGIFENIKKSIQFLLSCNIGEILTLFIAILLNWDSPLLPIHILWVNLVTDSLPALALGVEPVEKDIMNRPPRDPKKSIFADGLAAIIGIQGVMIGGLTLAAFAIGKLVLSTGASPEESVIIGRTMAFVTLGLSQLVHAFNVRTRSSLLKIGFFTNKYMIGAFVISLLLQMSVVTIPVLSDIFKVTMLNSSQWLTVAGLSIAPLILVELGKAVRGN
ncbi:MAG: P-type Ca2+ transporter type [Clostridiales bacterium]|jgi:Ca2+-transporting ATPase|nr:P-type Ca2+ transporter type [Clostridiales bacterium]MDK2933141.1 P-type Ca2+ transporter type [Clostridiales bacterium]